MSEERPYTLEDITLFEATLARAYIEGYRNGETVTEERVSDEVNELEERVRRLESEHLVGDQDESSG